jgi:glycosyltransferase involved in cell wall biosynthesis
MLTKREAEDFETFVSAAAADGTFCEPLLNSEPTRLHDHRLIHVGLTRGFAALAMARIIWELIGRPRGAFVSIPELPRRSGILRRFLRSSVQGVLTSADIAGRLDRIGFSSRIPLRCDTESQHLLGCPLVRAAPEAHRLVHLGELSPECGAAEFLTSVIAWAEDNPTVPIDITWLGDGDLRGILQAQPLPANLTQSFEPTPASPDMAASLARCGVAVIPGFSETGISWIQNAMLAGLPVLGSVRVKHIRSFVVGDETGWLFDPLNDRELHAALSACMATSPDKLDEMRAAARSKAASRNDAVDDRRSYQEPAHLGVPAVTVP